MQFSCLLTHGGGTRKHLIPQPDIPCYKAARKQVMAWEIQWSQTHETLQLVDNNMVQN